MNQKGSVEVFPEDEKEKVILTFGLEGCLGTLVFNEKESGEKAVTLSHYDPLTISLNKDNLKNLVLPNSQIKQSKYKQVLLFVAEDDI